MTSEEYGIIKRKTEFPPIDLLRVPHQGKDLVVAYPSFGRCIFRNNIAKMQKPCSHPITNERISFRAPNTSESVSAAAYNFGEMAKPEIFNPSWLQAGYAVRTAEGVFTNTQETRGDALNQMLAKAEKSNGIYLITPTIAFAPYESFKLGVQDSRDFAEGGLARALEHAQEASAPNLREISSTKPRRGS